MTRTRALACLVAGATLFTLSACASSDRDTTPNGPTILISLDGFRWDYRNEFSTPTLDQLAERGVVANLRPPFPSKTFPSHHSIATGLWPNRHGVVGNTMVDPELSERFSMGNAQAVRDGRWWGGEPIWVTAEKAGLIAATYFWPGTEAEILGVRPTYWVPFDEEIPATDRVDQVLAWLDLPAGERPHFLTLYFSDVDGAGHRHGPLSDETRDAVSRVDRYVQRLVDGLESRNLKDKVNLVIVSDHGMSPRAADRVVFIDDYIEVGKAGMLSLGEYVALEPDPDEVESIFNALDGAHPSLAVYRRGSIPDRLHLDGHPRTPEIVGVVDDGWTVSTHEWIDRRETPLAGGGHGYDNQAPNMMGIFIAAGPAFETGASGGTIDVVDVYNILAASLDIEPVGNQGNIDVLEKILEP